VVAPVPNDPVAVSGPPTPGAVAFIRPGTYPESMGTAGRLVTGLVLVTFVSVVALRPLVANPAIAGALQDGFGLRELLLVGPLVLVTLFIAGLRVRSMVADDRAEDDDREAAWDTRETDNRSTDTDRSSADDDTANGSNDGQPDPLSGQGGARDTEFEIEEKPPDARLHDHLDHLQAQLDSRRDCPRGPPDPRRGRRRGRG